MFSAIFLIHRSKFLSVELSLSQTLLCYDCLLHALLQGLLGNKVVWSFDLQPATKVRFLIEDFRTFFSSFLLEINYFFLNLLFVSK